MGTQEEVRENRFLRGQNRCKWVNFDRNMIPWDSGRTTIVKSPALICIYPQFVQRIYCNGHFSGGYFMVFGRSDRALKGPERSQSPRIDEDDALNMAPELMDRVESSYGNL